MVDDDKPSGASPRDPSRRGFLTVGGAALAGAVIGGAGGAAIGASVAGAGGRDGFADDPDPFAALAPRSEPGFDHVVVVMGENRSFDNLLGYLYTAETLPAGASHSKVSRSAPTATPPRTARWWRRTSTGGTRIAS